VVGHRWYLMAGFMIDPETNTRTLSKEVNCFDFITLRWLPLTPMKTARRHASAIHVNGYIYLFGYSIVSYPCHVFLLVDAIYI
jgi:hypothetical protein